MGKLKVSASGKPLGHHYQDIPKMQHALSGHFLTHKLEIPVAKDSLGWATTYPKTTYYVYNHRELAN